MTDNILDMSKRKEKQCQDTAENIGFYTHTTKTKNRCQWAKEEKLNEKCAQIERMCITDNYNMHKK